MFDGINHKGGMLIHPRSHSSGADIPTTGVVLGESLRSFHSHCRGWCTPVFDATYGVDWDDFASIRGNVTTSAAPFVIAMGRHDLPRHVTHLVCAFGVAVLESAGDIQRDRNVDAYLEVTDGVDTDTGDTVTVSAPSGEFRVVSKGVTYPVWENASRGGFGIHRPRLVGRKRLYATGSLAKLVGLCEVTLGDVDPDTDLASPALRITARLYARGYFESIAIGLVPMWASCWAETRG